MTTHFLRGNGQKPTVQSPLLNLAGWTKAHFFEKNSFKSFIKLLTLIRLLLQGKSHMQCIFTNIINSPVCCDKGKEALFNIACLKQTT